MSAFKAFFLGRLLREKLLLVVIVGLVALTVLSNFSGRVARAWRTQRATSVTLADQAQWLANRAAIEAGAGQAVKICNNMLLGISMLGVSEALNLAEALGLDAERFFEIASKSSGQCWSLTSYCPVPGLVAAAPSNRDFEGGFSTAMMLKDLKLAQGAAAASGASTPLGANAEALYALFERQGHGDKDFSAVIKLLAGRLDDLS